MTGISHVRRIERIELLKLSAFLTAAAVLTWYLVVIFADVQSGDRHEYRAVFDNISGLEIGDQVRVASVTSGEVTDTDVRPDATVVVTFELDDTIRLTDATTATVRYRNLIGDRYLALAEGSSPGKVLPSGATIPIANTASALDLDLLLSGFKPLFAGLAPAQINELSGQLIAVVQGQRSSVEGLVSTVASVAPAIADRQALLTQVLSNLDGVLTALDHRRDDLGNLLGQFSMLVRGLAKDDDRLYAAATSIDRFAVRGSRLLHNVRRDLSPDLVAMADALGQINENSDTLEQVLQRMPEHYKRVMNTASYGAFFNFYMCGVRVQLTDDDGRPFLTPWSKSEETRCKP